MLAMFASTLSGPRVSISDLSVDDVTVSPTNASATYQLTNAGVINQITVSGGTTSPGNWIFPAAAAGANYEVRATVNSGALTSGTTGSWTALSSTQAWVRQQTSIGTSSCNLTIEIRHATTLVVLDTASITLNAERA